MYYNSNDLFLCVLSFDIKKTHLVIVPYGIVLGIGFTVWVRQEATSYKMSVHC